MDAISFPPAPTNEPNLTYAPGTPERESLLTEIAALESESRDLPAYVGGEWRACGGEEIQVVQPHDHQHVLGVTRNATTADAQAAADVDHLDGVAGIGAAGISRWTQVLIGAILWPPLMALMDRVRLQIETRGTAFI